MSACFHLAGVYCDNCRTGLSAFWETDRYYTVGVTSSPVSVSETATKEEVIRLEAKICELQQEVRELRKLFQTQGLFELMQLVGYKKEYGED